MSALHVNKNFILWYGHTSITKNMRITGIQKININTNNNITKKILNSEKQSQRTKENSYILNLVSHRKLEEGDHTLNKNGLH